MCPIYDTCTTNYLSIDLIFLGSRTMVFQLWRLLLENHVGFCGFGVEPNICRDKRSLGDSKVQPWLQTIETD